MPLISGTVPSLINGISQQPPTLRMPTQGETQVNGLSHISRGLEKRPCTEHIANVAGVTSSDSNDVFIHTIRRSEDEAYALVVKGGEDWGPVTFGILSNTITYANHGLLVDSPVVFTKESSASLPTGISLSHTYYAHTITDSNTFTIKASLTGSQIDLTGSTSGNVYVNKSDASVKLFDLTGFATGKAGTEVHIHHSTQRGTVTQSGTLDTNVNTYLQNFRGATKVFEPNKLSATTIADFTFLLNKTQVVKKKTTLHTTSKYQSMVYIKVGDFGADYKVKISGFSNAEMTTPKSNFGLNGVFEITMKTPDNKTESMTGTGTGAKSKSINNQNAVLVKNIAYALHKGSDATTLASDVNLVKVKLKSDDTDDQNIDINVVANGAQDTIGNEDVYTGTVGVIDKGTVTNNFATNSNGLLATHGIEDLNVMSNGSTNDASTPWTVTYNASESIMTIENNEFPFLVEVTDGKGDTYMKAINGHDEVPKFSDLPATKVKKGFVAKISGDRGSGQDDYYVQYKDSVYKETFRPKYPLDTDASARSELDNTTMPMQLYKAFGTTTYNSTTSSTGDGIYFILKPVTWSARTVGDETTAPFPSFADYEEGTNGVDDALYTINDIFFHRNRLGFISDENVVLSEAAGYFNFFPNTVLSVLDTAPIDVAVSNNQVAILKSAIPFQENLLLFSDLQQF